MKSTQVNEILDLINKEELLEIEEKIQKALQKEQEQKQTDVTEGKDETFAESEKKFILTDKAEELGEPTSTADTKKVSGTVSGNK